jgi:hypothetical protein
LALLIGSPALRRERTDRISPSSCVALSVVALAAVMVASLLAAVCSSSSRARQFGPRLSHSAVRLLVAVSAALVKL